MLIVSRCLKRTVPLADQTCRQEGKHWPTSQKRQKHQIGVTELRMSPMYVFGCSIVLWPSNSQQVEEIREKKHSSL